MHHARTTARRILAIDPGTREMGLALLEGRHLLYHGVAVFSRRSSREILHEFRRIILRLIRDFRPGVLAVEKSCFETRRRTAPMRLLVEEFRAVGHQKKLCVLGIAANSVKKALCVDGHAAKMDVAKAVVAAFPELRVYLTQDRKWKARHHQNMFDAVALAIVCRGFLRREAEAKRRRAETD